MSILGHKSKRMINDRDFKLIGGITADYLANPEVSQTTGTPSGRQHQGLAEIRWKNIISICRT